MKKNKKIYKVVSATLAAMLISTSIFSSNVLALTSSEIREKLKTLELESEKIESKIESSISKLSSDREKIENLNQLINNYSKVIDETSDQKEQVDGQLQEVVETKNSVVEEIAKLNKQIHEKIEKIAQLEEENIKITNKIKETEKEIARLEAEVEKNTKLLEKRLVVMYKQGAVKNIEVLLSSESINDFLSRQTMMGTITKYDKELIQQLKTDKKALDDLRTELNGQKIVLEISIENTEKEKSELEKAKENQDKLYEELKIQEGLKTEEIEYLKSVTQEYEGYLTSAISNKRDLSNEVKKREEEIASLEANLTERLKASEETKNNLKKAVEAEEQARIEAERQAKIEAERELLRKKQEEIERKKAELLKLKEAEENQRKQETLEREQVSKVVESPSIAKTNSSDFGWPAGTSYITSYYGWRFIFGASDFHRGIDIGGPLGTPIYASKDGVIEYTGWLGGYGQLIKINHGDGYETRYAHLSRISVSPGQRVTKGQYIGAMGSTGNSTGSHLHFEILRYGETNNPLSYLR